MKHGWTKFVSMQNEYSLLYREEMRAGDSPALQVPRYRRYPVFAACWELHRFGLSPSFPDCCHFSAITEDICLSTIARPTRRVTPAVRTMAYSTLLIPNFNCDPRNGGRIGAYFEARRVSR
ncbi:hypothetical protein K523DRAFT_122442 [Schizophyllum commune Tattone D]|nr:hypothetical protein K523DRAFT_122442 [Schizophyllum commune Tattone D]